MRKWPRKRIFYWEKKDKNRKISSSSQLNKVLTFFLGSALFKGPLETKSWNFSLDDFPVAQFSFHDRTIGSRAFTIIFPRALSATRRVYQRDEKHEGEKTSWGFGFHGESSFSDDFYCTSRSLRDWDGSVKFDVNGKNLFNWRKKLIKIC